ncbi:hypothetical protein XENOCAPTIV_019757 [Xenoophorus captivus]|uniref:Uncharacterized protein n=1 Tax=Xenoophorus captivus TaxID=1517983 RepID=A0ABV0QK70_9TELE
MDMVDQQVEEGLAQVLETEETPEEIHIEDTLEEAIEEEQVVEETPRQELSEAADGEEEEPAAKRQQTECQLCEQRRAGINRLLQENRKLRSELNKKQLNQDFFKDDTRKVKYYTGLPCFVILLSLFNTVRPFLSLVTKEDTL